MISSALVSGVLMSCGGTGEEELIGDWQRRAAFPDVPRSYAATFVIGNKGYVVGGWNGFAVRRNDVYVFDHTVGDNGSWDQLDVFPGPRRSHSVGFSAGGFGYVGTGWDGDETDMRDFWRYNPNSDEWTEVAPLPDLARSRRGATAFSLSVGGKEYGYVGFGFHEGNFDRLYLLDIWRFDPDGQTVVNGETFDGSWTRVAEYGGSHKREGASAFVIDNKAYICCGKSNNTTVSEFWKFDPDGAAREGKQLWTKLRTMNDVNPDEDYDDDYPGLPRAYGVAYVVTTGGQLRGHIVGGDVSSGNASKNWEYDHDDDLWTQRTSFFNHRNTQSREGMVSFSFPNTGRAFVGLGKRGTEYCDDMWEFFPLEDDYIYDDY